MKTTLCVVLIAALAASSSAPAVAQVPRTYVGLVAGWASTSQQWKPEESTGDYTGLIAGAFARVPTSVTGLAIVAEGSYTRRGGDVTLDVGGVPTSGGIRGGYLTMALHVQLSRELGPIRGQIAAGPTLDQLLSSDLDPVLSQALDEERSTVFGVAVGGGLSIRVTRQLSVGIEARLTEGLANAYSGPFTEVRNRSLEGLLRVSVPLDSLR